MASESSFESWKYIAEDNTEIKEMQISDDVSALLESLLEDSQVDEAEDERLNCIIRSLEAEIDQPAIAADNTGDFDCESRDFLSEEDGRNCLGSYMFPPHDYDCWLDVEMASCLQSYDMEYSCTDELDRMEQYSHACLWQETYESMIYN